MKYNYYAIYLKICRFVVLMQMKLEQRFAHWPDRYGLEIQLQILGVCLLLW